MTRKIKKNVAFTRENIAENEKKQNQSRTENRVESESVKEADYKIITENQSDEETRKSQRKSKKADIITVAQIKHYTARQPEEHSGYFIFKKSYRYHRGN